VVKNKVAPPFRQAEFDILFGEGISYVGELIDLGLQHGVVLKSGTWLSMKHPGEGEIRLGQGREKARALLVDNPGVARDLELAIRARLSPAEPKPGGAAAPRSAAAQSDSSHPPGRGRTEAVAKGEIPSPASPRPAAAKA
jgi:recombination protein RecA